MEHVYSNDQQRRVLPLSAAAPLLTGGILVIVAISVVWFGSGAGPGTLRVQQHVETTMFAALMPGVWQHNNQIVLTSELFSRESSSESDDDIKDYFRHLVRRDGTEPSWAQV